MSAPGPTALAGSSTKLLSLSSAPSTGPGRPVVYLPSFRSYGYLCHEERRQMLDRVGRIYRETGRTDLTGRV